MTVTDRIGGWVFTILALLLPGVIATLFWSPFLSSDRFTNLFESLPPQGSVLKSYVPIGILASLPAILGFVVVLIISPTNGEGAAMSNNLLNFSVYLTIGYAVAVPILGAAVLPAIGVDWDEQDYTMSTWIVLGLGGAAYALIFAVPLFLFSLLLAFPS